jgi:hypothetical protein
MFNSRFHKFNLQVSASCPSVLGSILALQWMKMAGEMQLLLIGEMKEMAHHRIVKVQAGISSVSCEMQRQ